VTHPLTPPTESRLAVPAAAGPSDLAFADDGDHENEEAVAAMIRAEPSEPAISPPSAASVPESSSVE